jgi:hypothetical protein
MNTTDLLKRKCRCGHTLGEHHGVPYPHDMCLIEKCGCNTFVGSEESPAPVQTTEFKEFLKESGLFMGHHLVHDKYYMVWLEAQRRMDWWRRMAWLLLGISALLFVLLFILANR